MLTPPFNYYYALIYTFIPLIYFLSKESYVKFDIVYAVLFAVFLCPMSFGIIPNTNGTEISGYPISVSNLIQNIALVLLYLMLIIQGYVVIIKSIRKPKNLKMRATEVINGQL